MFCRNCGKEIRDDSVFCPNCGAVCGANPGSGANPGGGLPQGAAPYGAPSWEGPEGGRKKRRGAGLILGGIAVAAVAVAGVLAVTVGGLFASPKGQVEKALAKTAAAYSEINDKLGIPDMQELSKSRSVSQRFSLELNSVNEQLTGGYDLSALKGLGIRMGTDVDCKGRKMDVDLSAYWGSDNIAGFQLLVDDSNMYMGSSEFFGSDFLGVNTRTLGADLADLTGEDEVKKLSFNIFDLTEKIAPEGREEEMEKAMKEAGKALLDAAEVKKTGSSTIDVNGSSTKTTAYHVVIPQDALEDYVDALEDVMKTVDYVDLYRDILKEMGLPRDVIDEIMYNMEDADVYGEMADSLKDALDEIGDVELDVFLSGGYVSAITYEDKIMGTKIEAGLYLGGGSQYVDNLSLTVKASGGEFTLESSGNHSGRDGAYTNETTIRVRSNGVTLGRVTSEVSYTRSSGDFTWEVKADSSGAVMGSLEMDGKLTCGKNSMELVLDDISVKAMGVKLVSLSGAYSIGPCKGMTVSVGSSRMLADLDEDDLMDIAYDIERSAQDWVSDMQTLAQKKLPEDLLWYLMYYLF